LNLFFINIIND